MFGLPFRFGHARGRVASRRTYGVEGLESRTLLSVQPIGPEFVVNTRTVSNQTTQAEHRAVATDAAGNFVVVWESSEGSPGYGPLLYAQRFNAAGARRGGEIQITPLQMRGPYHADVAMDASGDFVVVFQDGYYPLQGVYSQRYNADGVPQGNNFLLTAGKYGWDPSVAMDADGDYVVAWSAEGPGAFDTFAIYTQRFDATGAAKERVFWANAGTTGAHLNPAVAMDARGDFVVAWEVQDGATPTSSHIQARSFDSQGTPRGNDSDVTLNEVRVNIHQKVAMDANGGFVVVWDAKNPNGVGYSVYARRYSPPGAPLGDAFRVNTTVADEQRAPGIAMDAAGDFVVTWMRPPMVMGQRFNAAGGMDGGEFRLDTPIAANPSAATVAMDYDGDFVAAWTGTQANDDIYARIYSAPQTRNVASGQVFHDLGADGAKDPGDPGLSGWRVYHDLNANGQLDAGTYPAPSITPLTGMQPFNTRRYVGPGPGPAAGAVITDVDVTINIQHPNDSDLTATLVSPAGTRAELFSHVGATGDDFTQTHFDDSNPMPIPAGVAPFTGTYRTQNFTLGGFNSERLTDDGYWMLEVRNDGPSGGYVLSWVVTITYSEDSVLSDAGGNYSLSLPDGASTIRQAPQSGWVQTDPPNGAGEQVYAGGGQTIVGLDFGNAYAGVISGSVFDDRNADGTNGAGEGLLPGWKVFADLNGNGQPDPTEPSTTSTNPFGYTLRGVPLNRPVSVGVILPPTNEAPWELSVAPGPVSLTAAQPRASTQNFGAFRRGMISGSKFNDRDGNGLRSIDEPGLPGWTIFLDQNGNGQLDGGPLTWSSSGNAVPIAPAVRAPSVVTSAISVLDQAGPVIDVNVTLNISHPDLSGLVVVLISPLGNRVQLFGELPRGSANFTGTTFDDQAASDIVDGAAPYEGSFVPLEPLVMFNGEDPNGAWTLEVSNGSRASGTIDGWSLRITTPAEPSTITDAIGYYAFHALRPGFYAVREHAQPGWEQTGPGGGFYPVTLTSGQSLFDFNFGARLTAVTPRVTRVYAGGSAWSAAFNDYVAAQSLGSARYGFALGGLAGQLADLPWLNVNRVSFAFSADVQVDPSDLAVRGVNVAAYTGASFAYDTTDHTATWTFPQNFAKDKVLLDLDGDAASGVRGAGAGGQLLDGEWATGAPFPSGNGAAGGDFRFRFNLLPGNVNRVGSVLADDFSAVKARFFRSTTSPGSGATAYSIFHDVDGSGSILANDFSAVKSRFFSALPGPEPTGTALATESPPAIRRQPARTNLLSPGEILG